MSIYFWHEIRIHFSVSKLGFRLLAVCQCVQILVLDFSFYFIPYTKIMKSFGLVFWFGFIEYIRGLLSIYYWHEIQIHVSVFKLGLWLFAVGQWVWILVLDFSVYFISYTKIMKSIGLVFWFGFIEFTI